MINTVKIDRKPEECTCCGDIVRLLRYSIGSEFIYELYECSRMPIETGIVNYFLKIHDDQYPHIITAEEAQKILADPEIGRAEAFNTFMYRYR